MKQWVAAVGIAVMAQVAIAGPVSIQGTVVRVVDGDTFVLDRGTEGEPLTVRLQGIDAPEICQVHGPQAKQALEQMVLGQGVQVVASGRDDHGRTLGKLVNGTLDVGDRMVRDGHAWSYRYRNDRGPYMASERMARALRRGLHADVEAIEPRVFRKRHGACPVPA
jgi:endonuclease YncB( thermonuclease family)